MRLLLYPFSVLYAIITNLRNLLFDVGILPSKTFDIPIICIGNLTVGGTGKTPLTAYIISVLEGKNMAVISRGYGRNTRNRLDIGIKRIGNSNFICTTHPKSSWFFIFDNSSF
mgnify:CR=1 FL=1